MAKRVIYWNRNLAQNNRNETQSLKPVPAVTFYIKINLIWMLITR